jgi:transketolase
LVSFPSWELFEQQDDDYKKMVFPPGVKARLAVEAGRGQGWERYVGDNGALITVEKFGASAPSKVIFEKYGFSVENVLAHARKLIQ